MNITYCDGWFRTQKRAVDIWTDEQARKAHEGHEPYTALLGDAAHPWCFIEVTGDSMAVEFLDDNLRSYTDYIFQTKRPGWLFVCRATYREFVGDSDVVARAVLYYYRLNGSVTVHNSIHKDSGREVWEAKTTIDIDANWEPYPAFGKYESIARLDRGLPRID